MPKRVAVEDGLTDVKQALRDKGFEIAKLSNGTMTNIDACVVTGMSDNFMGIEDTSGNKFPVIRAAGMTAEEIVDLIQNRITEGR
ncbi:MAG TPA: YkuS family protein [Symbiobacteriaceae bacterium]|nr:YkuS family protein [Symbiobacteriaceae bacterium]